MRIFQSFMAINDLFIGVSESQYHTVLDEELEDEKSHQGIRDGLKKVYINKTLPKVSIIVCGKRHHTRFYPTAESHKDKKFGGNPVPGVVVDRHITMAKGWDFFLQAQRSAAQ